MLASLLAQPGTAWAEYLLQPGESVHFAVSGVPELSTISAIDIDGALRLPHVGGWMQMARDCPSYAT